MTDSPPPGRLRVRTELDHQVFELPPDLRGAGMVYWTLALGAALAAAAGPFVDNPGWEGWLAAIFVFGLTTGMMSVVARALATLVRWMADRPAPALLLSVALITLASGALVGLGAGLVAGAGLGLVNGLFYTGILWLLSRRRATVRLDQQQVRIEHGKARVDLPLETAPELQRHGRVLAHVTADGAAVPGLGHLSDRELAWVQDQIRAQAQRSRAEVQAQGLEPGQAPQPPPELLAALQRQG